MGNSISSIRNRDSAAPISLQGVNYTHALEGGQHPESNFPLRDSSSTSTRHKHLMQQHF
jgi:hypothetical protein